MKKTHILETDLKTINGESIVGDGDIDLEGLSTLSSPKLNQEILTERRHPISGKPLYTRTINFGSLPNATVKSVNHGVSNTDWFNADLDNSYIIDGNGINMHPLLATDRRCFVTPTAVSLTTTNNQTNRKAIVTVQYTKSTDTTESPVRLVGGGGSSELVSLTDTEITSPENDDVLAYDDATGKWINKTITPGGDVNLDDVYEKIGEKQDILVSGETIKTINNEPILGSGNISIEQNIDASTLTEGQLEYLRDKEIKYGQWAVEQVAINLTINQTKLPMFYTKYIGNLEPINKYSFLCKAGKIYEISYSIIAAMSAVGQYNFAIFNDNNNSTIWNTTITNYAGPTAGTQYRGNIDTSIVKFDIDTPISIRPYTAPGNITTMYGSRVIIKEISIFDASLKNFKINGKSFDENNNIDLEGLSTLSYPKLNVEVLTERRHPVSQKPIYTKTINFGAMPNNTAKAVNHGISNVENININESDSYLINTDNNWVYGISLSTPSLLASNWFFSCTKTAVNATTGQNRTNFTATIVLEYTKTTDTVNSPVRLVGGEKGEDGIDGTNGIDGKDGQDGVDGKSAYELYVANLPQGETPLSETEWLETLKGEDGLDGLDGQDGAPGKSAYELYLETVPQEETPLTETEWLNSFNITNNITTILDAETLSNEQLDYLRDKQLKFGTWGANRSATAPITFVPGTTKFGLFHTKYKGSLVSTNGTDFLLKAGKTYKIEVELNMLAPTGFTNFITYSIFNNSTNTKLSHDQVMYPPSSTGRFMHTPMLTDFITPTTDTSISIRLTSVGGSASTNLANVDDIKNSRIRISEISSFDVSLKNFKINGKSFDNNNNIDLEGLSTLSNPILNVETLTEFRHPVSSKPIYTKTINFGSLPNATTKLVAHGVPDAEDLWIDESRSYVRHSNGGLYSTTFSHPTNLAATWSSDSNETNVRISTGNDRTALTAIITILYTKTTDTAESPVRLVGGGVPTGSIIYHTSNIPPKGYLKANGATLLREEFPDLFAVIGTTYGSDTELDFKLPDLRGEFIRGYDDGRGVDTSREFGSNQTDTIQNITGKLNSAPIGTANGIWSSVWANGGAFVSKYQAYDTRPRIGFTNYSNTPYMEIEFNASRIVRTSTETRPRNIALLPCIKY